MLPHTLMLYQLGSKVHSTFPRTDHNQHQSEPLQGLSDGITVLSLFIYGWTLPREAAEFVASSFVGDMISI